MVRMPRPLCRWVFGLRMVTRFSLHRVPFRDGVLRLVFPERRFGVFDGSLHPNDRAGGDPAEYLAGGRRFQEDRGNLSPVVGRGLQVRGVGVVAVHPRFKIILGH